MKYFTLSIILFTVSPIIGCMSADGRPEFTRRESRAAQDYASNQKAEFVSKMNKELNERWKELAQLSVRIENFSEASKSDAKIKLAAVHEKWALAQYQLDRAERSTESTWDDMKAHFNESYDELNNSITETRSWLNAQLKF
jgi:hypothetical protein